MVPCMMPAEPQTLSRGIDYLGSLSRILRDLSGPATLIYELVQNADDAPGATAISFDVRQESLVVWNNGVFSDCGRQDLDPDECPWRERGRGVRCDFHRFRRVSAGDKARDADLTGAFGIGFTAVYQITDKPELISAGRHWIIDETLPEESRIRVCESCDVCGDETGTRFVLPWATDPKSEFRVHAKVPHVDQGIIESLTRALLDTIPTAMLFLKKIRKVEILHDSVSIRTFDRVDDGNDVLIGDGQTLSVWRLLTGDFHADARSLQAKYPDKIDKSAEVQIAVPRDQELEGQFCAYLPTEETTGLPFHVNADFFPRSDRKGLITSGYQGEWNAAAVAGAARLVADRLVELREVYRPRRLWAMIHAAHQVFTSGSMKRVGLELGAFWTQLANRIQEEPILWTTAEEWSTPAGAYVVRDPEEIDSALILADLDNVFAHPDLRQYCLNLPGYGGLTQLTLTAMVGMLEKAGLTERREFGELPEPLRDAASRSSLLEELERLLARSADQRRSSRPRLEALALAPGLDGALWPWETCFSADPIARRLFHDESGWVGFLDEKALPEDSAHLRELVTPFGLEQAVEIMEDDERLVERLDPGDISTVELLEWLTSRSAELEDEPDLMDRLAGLSIYPTRGAHRPLAELVLPGGFPDRLGLSDVVDLRRAGNALPLLRSLGCKELTLASYVTRFVPRTQRLAQEDPERWRELIILLASRLDEIASAPAVRDILGRVPVVITEDGFSLPADAYFGSEVLDAVLRRYTRAILPQDHDRVVSAFYEWLDVAREPRPEDLMSRLRSLGDGPVTEAAIQAVSRVVEYLGTHWKTAARSWAHLEEMKSLRWLPARSDTARWCQPGELYVVFQDYLFASQAKFLGLPAVVQRQAVDFLQALGVGSTPTTSQVVEHLLNCAKGKAGMNAAVYTYLNQNADDPEIAMLKDHESILLPDGRWVKPKWVFWGDQPFGRFRATLSDDFQGFRALLARLGVREQPDSSDALEVLLEMSGESASMNTPLESDADRQVYAACWRLMAEDLTSGQVRPGFFAAVRERKVVADGEWLLTSPDWILFEDVPGLADRFDRALKRQLIRRPEGYWTAMREAGVRDLSRAIVYRILELGDHDSYHELRTLLQRRMRQIGRVLDGVDPHLPSTLPSRLADVKFVRASELVVQFELSDLNLVSSPAPLQSLYDPGKDTLFVQREVPLDDLELAREVARALAPDVPPGGLAPSVLLVLSAGTPEEADRKLDAVGVARLAEDVVGEAEPQIVVGFGGERETAEVPAPLSVDSGAADETGPADEDAEGKTERVSGPAARGRLRSYVVTGSTSNDEFGVAVQRDREISAIDRAGVDRVMAFEVAAGRMPKEMEHQNPGYDVESSGPDGYVLRYIEVKSLGGDWTEFGVSVTPRQMDEARRRREQFWLYVVERAQFDDFEIHPIPDPWTKVSQFMFDDPWKLAAALDDSAPEE